MSKCANCNELVGEEWSANNGLCTTCARDGVSEADTNQTSEDELLMTPAQIHQLTPPSYGGDFELTMEAEL